MKIADRGKAGDRTVTIYAFLDDDGRAWYVGRTGNLRRRIGQHMSGYASGGDHHGILARLRNQDVHVDVHELVTVSLAEADEAECAYIGYFSAHGHPLINKQLVPQPPRVARTYQLPVDVAQWIKNFAARQGITENSVFQNAIREFREAADIQD